ncbi:ornithine carbamoyltransferase [Synechococcus sp. RSCCF101]|uniref:ornithine carbamoyltransferase n=1 Tax=Synechococcus sp. RSCCF101 TaxID=2511069 RepID=UPI001248631F|nr:ornithine carbamoyltransferase [Synechococcus sp. RSCCF101]QEY31962.1 ornithine carbamoyltransferase [Synechococcus sp. RSCCF101]
MTTVPHEQLQRVLAPLSGRDYLSSTDADADQTRALLDLALQLKSGERRIDLSGRILGLIFTKASTRTRVSFNVAMARLNGQTLDLNPAVTQVGRGEPLEDTARVLSRYCDVLAVRTYDHEELERYAHWATVPVVNALTDLEHPCQALADYLTMEEHFGALQGLTMAYVGDGNNVAHSLVLAGALLGVNVTLACPQGYDPDAALMERAGVLAQSNGCRVQVVREPLEAVRGAHALYTDVWASMGQEEEQAIREKAFRGYCLDETLLSEADARAIVLHCLPAHRGEEISAGVMEGEASRVFDQAENRLHAQQALLAALMGGV